MIEKLKSFWCCHGQKSIASVLGALAVVDMTPWEESFHDLLPWPHWHAALRLAGATGIFWRALQR